MDGHWSVGNTGKEEKDCLLYEELLSFDKNAIIIIDDVRLFGKGPSKGDEVCNWEDISVEKIFEITKERLKEYCFLPSILVPNDRLLINLKETLFN